MNEELRKYNFMRTHLGMSPDEIHRETNIAEVEKIPSLTVTSLTYERTYEEEMKEAGIMACCSSQCERKRLCAHYIGNPRESDRVESVESYYWFGSCSYSSKGCEEHYWCGPHGDWGMFTPINVELLKKQRDALDKTIRELESGKYD